jgi:hypothetical protein
MDLIWLAAGFVFFLVSCGLMQFFHSLRAED